LQEELFGHHIAGEVFFRNLQDLLGKTDSPDLADLLEVYQLCLLLGFAGRYSLGGRGELRAVGEAVAEKIRRIRGVAGDLSPAWALPPEAVHRAGTDPLVRKFGVTAAACGLLAVILFAVYKLILGSGVSTLRDLAGRL
jgi:type VI secretion system protein ImpK